MGLKCIREWASKFTQQHSTSGKKNKLYCLPIKMQLFVNFYKNNVLTKVNKWMSSTQNIVLSQTLLLINSVAQQHFRELHRTKATHINGRQQ